jgi:hypothetical protein
MKPESEHPDTLEAKGQIRLMSDLGPRRVPKWRERGPDRGADDLPLFAQNDDRQLEIEGPK